MDDSFEPKEFVIYTGYSGMIMFDLCMQGFMLNTDLHWDYTEHKYGGMVLHFVAKHHNVKARVNRQTGLLDIYDGTTYIASTKQLAFIEKYIKSKGYETKRYKRP